MRASRPILFKVLGITFFMFLGGCASKNTESQLSTLQAENKSLAEKVVKLQSELSALSEDVLLLKGKDQQSDPVLEKKEAQVVQEEPFDDRDPFFEESIAAEEETLIITNKDLQNVKWGDSSSQKKSPAKGASAKVNSSQAKIDYQNAYQEYKNSNFEKCRTLMLAFIQKYPKHEFTDNAYFWIGETYYEKGDFASANTYYKDVIQKFPNENKVPDAMYRSASCALNMSQYSIAKQSLEVLIKRYPETVAATKAQKTLKTIK